MKLFKKKCIEDYCDDEPMKMGFGRCYRHFLIFLDNVEQKLKEKK